MAHLNRSKASLRIFGDSLIPAEVTRLLGCEPSQASRKGDLTPRSSGVRVAKHGSWHLQAPDTEPEGLDGQVAWILGQLTSNLDVWAALGKEFNIDMFCGLFMESWNEGFSLSPATMAALSSRGIKIDFDIYDSTQ
jgi:hypothetical protein